MKKYNWDLSFWDSGEWQVIQERLDDYDKQAYVYAPARSLFFHSLKLSPLGSTRVCIIGQDPYSGKYQGRDQACGLAFSVPEAAGSGGLPPTLKNIFREYESDLGYPTPKNGDLTPWANQGVLLWNVYPMLVTGPQRQNCHWPEWLLLTEEIVRKLDVQNKTIFILLGSFARSCSRWISNCPCIETSHPSPLAADKGFLGSKIFTRTNELLISKGLKEIDWRLPDAEQKT